LILTDDEGLPLGGGHASLAETSLGSMRAKDRMLPSLIARRRRQVPLLIMPQTRKTASTAAWARPARMIRTGTQMRSSGSTRTTIATATPSWPTRSSRACKGRGSKDEALVNLLMDIADGDASLDMSYDESLSELRDRFLD